MKESTSSQDPSLSVEEQLELFGQKIRQFRTARGLTQLELAENSALDRKTISRIENHQFSPSLSTIFSIASALEVDPKDLLP
jgi:transcriptional regulator with XRE-family HTH domain